MTQQLNESEQDKTIKNQSQFQTERTEAIHPDCLLMETDPYLSNRKERIKKIFNTVHTQTQNLDRQIAVIIQQGKNGKQNDIFEAGQVENIPLIVKIC